MTAKFKGLAQRLGQLHHNLELQAGPIFDDADALDAEAAAAVAAAKQKMAETRAAMEDIKAFVAEMGATNGGPTLSDSAESPATAEPVQHVGPNGGPRILTPGAT